MECSHNQVRSASCALRCCSCFLFLLNFRFLPYSISELQMVWSSMNYSTQVLHAFCQAGQVLVDQCVIKRITNTMTLEVYSRQVGYISTKLWRRFDSVSCHFRFGRTSGRRADLVSIKSTTQQLK